MLSLAFFLLLFSIGFSDFHNNDLVFIKVVKAEWPAGNNLDLAMLR